MLKLKQSILAALLLSALSVAGHAEGPDVPGATADASGEPSATVLLSAYRDSGQPNLHGADWHRTAIEARDRAEADLRHARAQLTRARAEVARLIGEIRIEGAEALEIGGEVRHARLIEAEWQRAVDTVSDHIGRIDAAIAMRGGDVARAPKLTGNR